MQPWRAIAGVTRQAGVPFHLDAVGVLGRLPIAVEVEGIDLLTVGANDLCGPPGVGALWMRSGLHLAPQVLGARSGGRPALRDGEPGRRGRARGGGRADLSRGSGGGGAARGAPRPADRGPRHPLPALRFVGPRRGRLPQHAAFVGPGIKGESLVLALDLAGISASSGTACSELTGAPSAALRALGLGEREAQGAIAFTLGRWTTADDIDVVLTELPPIVERLRAASPLA